MFPYLFLLISLTFINSMMVPLPVSNYPKTPVYNGHFADPFAWEYNGSYYMIGTGSDQGQFFPTLISNDAEHWQFYGYVMIPRTNTNLTDYWAPEVAVHENLFYLYYSGGIGDKLHRLRVATSTNPLGPYRDDGAQDLTDITKLQFAIDPHAFRDVDGKWYLFYSRDFLDTNDGYRVGTGIVIDILENMTKLGGNERVVLRAKHDWQRFAKDRYMPQYNGTWDWYTLEGAATWMQDGRYYCFYSGGRWEDETYGVDYGVSSNVLGPYVEDSDTQARITHSINGIIIGPGHNSIILGPDQYTRIVYHALNNDRTMRSPYISQLDWSQVSPSSSPTTTTSSVNDLHHEQGLIRVVIYFLVYMFSYSWFFIM
ncbi:unnamed protein product [Didymodactylos carnosus]|uniref:Endo-1,5-alpha-L-arabinanase A n=1 Tax=Didymodactylos carnosus TaxID=1234261 RepID=A0A8S2JM58_9BILA|nr:unnamed protein product [Didymodactylos carnosus]CAF3814180.1 unnamed protein product [Didymodactylos carnosus]